MSRSLKSAFTMIPLRLKAGLLFTALPSAAASSASTFPEKRGLAVFSTYALERHTATTGHASRVVTNASRMQSSQVPVCR
jgi:hypothetical protein